MITSARDAMTGKHKTDTNGCVVSTVIPRLKRALIGLSTLAIWSSAVLAAEVPSEAIEALDRLEQHLSGLDSIRFQAQVTEETVYGDDHKIQFEGTMDVAMEQPVSFSADLRSDHYNRQYRLQNGLFTVFDEDVNVFAQARVPGTLKEAFRTIAVDYGTDMPMSDLLSARARELLVDQATRVAYIGIGSVDDHKCHHIAGTLPDTDWQIWIRTGEDPWLCKYIVTDRNAPMAPQFTLRFRKWEANPDLTEAEFRFVPQAGVEKIEFISPATGAVQ